MRLFEAILEANHRAAAGDAQAGLHPAEFAGSLPVVALTCIDPRLNPLMPEVLGIAEEDFIWLRNAGNIITHPLSSTMRSLALACAIKGGKEIAIIGHTDCRVRQTSVLELTNQFRALDIERTRLPENLSEFFGLFASERQNVINAVDRVRRSPLIGPKIPVHGLLVDLQSGQLEWLVNGYQAPTPTLAASASESTEGGPIPPAQTPGPALGSGAMKFPEAKIGEGVASTEKWLAQMRTASPPTAAGTTKSEPTKPPPIPLPPPIRPAVKLHAAPKKPR